MRDPRTAYVDKPLSNKIISWNPQGFIADQIFPVVTVGQQGGMFFKWERADFFRVPSQTLRSPGTEPRKAEFRVGTDTYFCPNYALGGEWSDEELANADTRPNYREGKVRGVKGLLMLDYEARVAAQVLSTANVGSYSTPASLWSDKTAGNSDPIGDLQTYIDAIEGATGFRPNRAAMGRQVYDKLKWHGDIRGLLFPHGGGIATPEQLAQVFGLEKVLVAGALQGTTGDDSTTLTLSRIWGRHLLLYYASDEGMLEMPSYGYSMRWNQPSMPAFQVTVHPRNTKARAEEFDVGYYQDEKLAYTDLAFLVQSVF